MNIKPTLTASLLFVLFLVFLQSCSLSDGVEENAQVSEAKWTSLITNDSLENWKKIGGDANYRLENDTIVGTSINSKHSTYFTTGEIYSDFILEVDVFAEAPLNSGIQFRSQLVEYDSGTTVMGYQMEIDTEQRAWSGGIYDQGRRGWLYNLSRNPACQKEFKVEQWNRYRIEALGNEIRTYINNVPCSNLVDELSPKGFIAFQIHSAGSKKADKIVKWREPKIITENVKAHLLANQSQLQLNYLDNRLTDYQKSQGWELLWKGKSLSTLNTQGKWQVEDGILQASSDGNLKNTIDFSAVKAPFEFELAVKSSQQADNGIHYLLGEEEQGYKFQLSGETQFDQINNNKTAMGAIWGKVAAQNLSEPKGSKNMRINRDWNHIRLVVKDNRIEHWINNIKVVDYPTENGVANQSFALKIENASGDLHIKSLKLRHMPPNKKNPGDREGHVMKEVVPKELIPEAPILPLKEALNAFVVHPDFAIETIANSPLVYDPVFAIYDPAGRIWVLEMTTYMLDELATGEMQHESQIVVLTDTNNDGQMDDRQVVLEKLLLPRSLAFVEKGILWADHTSLYFTELDEKNGKFTAIKTDLIDPKYAAGGNIEHKPNGMLYSLDNWYYNAKSDNRYRPYPLSTELPAGSKEIYRNKYWKMAISKTEFRGQWGISQDDFGRHYFLHNSTPLQTTSFLPNVATRNPKLEFPAELLLQNVGNNDVYPIRMTPGINRGYIEGMLREDTYTLKANTSAGGPVVYRGNQYPEKYQSISLVTESAANLVRANKILEKDGIVSGENLFEQQEILASTDERFRPVHTNNTPDGTIMIVDFYHGIIQHRTFMTSYLHDQILSRDLQRSKHIGRLYRLKHKNSAMPEVTFLDGLNATQLLPFLGHENGWHRDMAQQLLVMKQDMSVVDELKNMTHSHPNRLARIKALWVLEGLANNDFSTLKAAAKNGDEKVKRSVYRLLELLPANSDTASWLIAQSETANEESAAALVLAAGTHKAWQATANIIKKFGVSPFVLASLSNNEGAFLELYGKTLPEQSVVEITKLHDTILPTNKAITGKLAKSFTAGKSLYNGKLGCFGCHGADGKGSQLIPPLDNSEWVTGNQRQLVALLLHGYSGPIEVDGKTYDNGMVMPGLKLTPGVSDKDIADIATYIRNEWSNSASAVQERLVESVRKKTESQDSPYTAESIKSLSTP